ncbi:hypothetical protein ACHAPJ_010696 [Fusarium lateritium]
MDSLPDELIALIISNLTAHDLTNLSPTSKRLNRLTEPQLWANIEFHHSCFHEQLDVKHPAPMVSATRRFYHWGPDSDLFAGQLKANKFFGLLQVLQSEDLEQLKRLCARVKSICTVIRFDIDVWQLLPYFTNLEAIELYGSQYRFEKYELTSLDASVPPLSKLRFVKLVGYIPRAVATWIMESGTNIERLELDMLDRAIESKSTMDDDFIRHPEDVYIPDDWLIYERILASATIPRPLSGFLPPRESRRCPLTLLRLQHLHLCQPSYHPYKSMVSYFWSTGAEVATHADWTQILLASSQTLEILVVEQRIGLDYEEGSWGNADLFLKYDQSGQGSKRLMDTLEKVLTEETFPALRYVCLRGVVVGSDTHGKPIGDVPGGRFMRFLEKMGIKCEARLGEGCMFDADSGIADPTDWKVRSEIDQEPVEEEFLASV